MKAWIVDREERRRAEDAVCGNGAAVGITTSLWGAGGFGKTTIAEMVCDSPRVREHYKGGVYSFIIGREVRGRADIAARVAEVTRFITGDTEQFSDPAEAGRHLGRLLDQRKRTLLLLDDVWTDEQLEPFLHGATHCVRLITTRVPSLLPVGTQTIQVDQMTLDQARTVLTRDLDGLPPLTTGALLDATGRWALLLRLVNRQIKAQVETGQDPARAAEEMLHQLRVHGPQGVDPTGDAIDVDRPEERRRAIRATVEAATGLLPQGGMERFAELAIFAEDEAVPLPLIARLWQSTGGLSERASRELCAQLAGLSLLSLTRDDGGRIRLHDVIRDYLLSAQDPTRLAALHGQFVDAAADGLPDAAPSSAHAHAPHPAWWELTDGYLQDHLIEHLVAAGRTELAEATASDLRWVEDRLVRHGANAPQRDLSHVPTADAASRARSLAQVTHLLAPTDPAPLVVNTLYSRLAFLPSWRDQVTGRLATAPVRPVLVGLWPPPDLPARALLATLTGHGGGGRSVAISPDGTWLASGGKDGAVRLWDRASGRCTATLTGHTRPVTSVAISTDGTWLATACKDDERVQLWDRASGRCTATLTGHTSAGEAVAISPDGTWLATGSSDRKVRLWDRATGQCTATLTGHTNPVTSVAISPDGSWFATGGWDGKVRLWDRATGECTATLTGHTTTAVPVAISPDGSWFASGGGGGEVRLWDRATGECTATLTGHTRPVTSVAISTDGTWLASGGGGGEVRLWDRATGQCTATLTGHTSPVNSVAVVISPDGTWLATGSVDGEVRLWDRVNAAEGEPATPTNDVQSVAISPDGSWLATGGGGGEVRLWDRATGQCTATLTGHTGAVQSAAISPDGTWLATASRDRKVRLWDRATGECTATLTGHTNPAEAVAISPDGTWLATGDVGGEVRLWDRATGQCTATLTRDSGWGNPVVISPGGTWLATTNFDGEVLLWDRATGQCTATLTGHTNPVDSMAISPDGTWLASGDGGGEVRLWDRATGQCTATLTGFTGRGASVAISPDGTWLATTSYDGEIRVWNVRSRCLTTLVRTEGRLSECTWASHDWTLVAAGAGGLHLIELRT
ncbi:NB-ARC domain-containing protein [Streptomyces sp. NPDC055092]